MAATQIAIFYATKSGMLRGVLVPDDDIDLLNCHAPAGETMIVVPAFPSAGKGVVDPANHQYVIDQVTKAIGFSPPDPSCAVVDANGVVESIIAADEALDTLPEKTLVQCYSPEIAPGCTYDAVSKEFTVPAKVIPAGKSKLTGLTTAQIDIPAKTLIRPVVAHGILL